MMSPALDLNLNSSSVAERGARDPLINPSWGRQAVKWMKTPEQHPLGNPKALSLLAYPPALIQVGEDEVLFDDSTWAAQALSKAGRHAELEIYLKLNPSAPDAEQLNGVVRELRTLIKERQ